MLHDWVSRYQTVQGFPHGEPITNDQLLTLDADVVIPAATEGTVTADVALRMKCKILAEAANGPTTIEADRIIRERGDIFIIPDVLANAGGVVVSYFEWVQDLQNFFWNEKEINRRLWEVMTQAFHNVHQFALERKVDMRMAALMVGIDKVARAMLTRGFYP
jgi:glutamate dehydrogenase (NAD(P)+)